MESGIVTQRSSAVKKVRRSEVEKVTAKRVVNPWLSVPTAASCIVDRAACPVDFPALRTKAARPSFTSLLVPVYSCHQPQRTIYSTCR